MKTILFFQRFSAIVSRGGNAITFDVFEIMGKSNIQICSSQRGLSTETRAVSFFVILLSIKIKK